MLQYMPDLLVLRNEHAHLVDYLAYVDGYETLKGQQNDVKALVDQQMADMAKSGVKDYLKDFPQPTLTKIDSAAIQAEIARVTSQQKPDTSLCDVYVSADAPNSHEISAW